MESPQLYDSADYKKASAAGAVGGGPVKVKGGTLLYPGDDYSDLAELSAPEISLDLHGLIDDSQFNDGLIQDIQGLTVDKSSNVPRGLGVNNMYNNPLAYLPQPVHGAAQFDRHYGERSSSHHHNVNRPSIKEEPQEALHDVVPHEYSACARAGSMSGGYGTSAAAYAGVVPPYAAMTPTTVPGVDSLCKSPLRSPSSGKIMPGCKKNVDKSSDEYKRRRERNNIAVRKSREKAKMRSRETEERVKKLIMDNDRLHKKCELLSKEVAVFHSMFANVHCLPDHVQRELRKQMDAFNQQHQHLLNM
ncbi:hypothetical protein SK128_006626 [Halocaridina rubra]|uniref:BZIP domain-containing protein n=1 Tax=Halocaridina rubra TaxID=373956 RepID=A0AAN9FUW4_HALRR